MVTGTEESPKPQRFPQTQAGPVHGRIQHGEVVELGTPSRDSEKAGMGAVRFQTRLSLGHQARLRSFFWPFQAAESPGHFEKVPRHIRLCRSRLDHLLST